jgi:eukaryotic-like serine/threonine-protein kinase
MQPRQLLNHRYQIEGELATGGFGQTFIARDTNLPSQPQVVVKLLKPQSNDPATLQIAQRLFRQEAEILEKLGENNDRIPTLYAYFESGNDFYLVQELIDGITLADELGGKRLSESDTLDIVREILVGLETVHSRNYIHRDLKPDNIIRRRSDRKLVLLDFGAVKQVRAASATVPMTIISQTIGLGTPGYMPTEQAMGSPKPASDIYAVGAIAIQCLTGHRPDLLFDTDTLKLEWRHLCQVDRHIASVLEQMVEPDYHQRYANATEALSAIEFLISPSLAATTLPPPNPTPQQSAKTAPPPPPVTPQAKPEEKPLGKSIDRRSLLKLLGFGGGLFAAITIAQLSRNSSSDRAVKLTKVSNSNPFSTTKYQLTSVRLNDQGEVISRPTVDFEVFTEDLGRGAELRMVKIPAGRFLMGQSPAERAELTRLRGESEYEKLFADESPSHQVDIPEFYLAQTQVTQAQWMAIMGNNPANFRSDDKLPVEGVNWLDAMDFCQKLSEKTGKTYRLPSEAEREYASRAGTSSPFTFGETITPEVVNYNGNYPYAKAVRGTFRKKTTPAGTFPPNLFGLYDMHGNVWEWCLDEWVNNYRGAPTDGSARGDIRSRDENKQRLLRGGSWVFNAGFCRCADRDYNTASYRNSDIGFRVVCTRSKGT